MSTPTHAASGNPATSDGQVTVGEDPRRRTVGEDDGDPAGPGPVDAEDGVLRRHVHMVAGGGADLTATG